MTPEQKTYLVLAALKIIAVFTAYNVAVMLVIWAERRVSGWMQDRLGPNRVGPEGLLQSVADGLKNIMKEETFPAQRDRTLFLLAPVLSFIPAMLVWAVIPFAAPLPPFDFTFEGVPILGTLLGWTGRWVQPGPVAMVVADLPVGFLFILAISSLGVYGIVLAGWASNSKYALLGGLRASAQMVSYEISMGMSLIAVLLLAGNITLSEIVATQQRSVWFIFTLTLAFLLFLISALAETNRLPFDLPETESELITGYHTEYSSMKFSMFFIAEYANLITASALVATLFFGGWDIPLLHWDDRVPEAWSWGVLARILLTHVSFALKTLFFVFVYIWIRWTLPRFRFDQLMQLGWKAMIPAALGYIVVIATAAWGLSALGWALEGPNGWKAGLVLFALNAALVGWLLWGIDRGRLLVGSRREHGPAEA